jgi:tRNA(Ile)-lysidine synthase
MLTQLEGVMADKCQALTNRPILLAVSGGPDSLYLLAALHQLKYPIVIAHFDHQLRLESAGEAQALSVLAASIEVPVFFGRADVSRFAKDHKLSIEDAGRRLRYQFLFERAFQLHAQAVVTGHTADDQVETVLLHLLRGAGLFGLRGMKYRSLPNSWSKDIPLLRPLLGVWRSQIDLYFQENPLKPFSDPSNQDTRFTRNHLRHEILPVLENLSPGFKQHLWHSCMDNLDDFSHLEQTVFSAWHACLKEIEQSWISFDHRALLNASPALQRHLIWQAARHLLPDVGEVDFPTLQRACKFIQNPVKSRQIDWLGGLRLRIAEDCIWLARWDAILPDELVEQYPQIAAGGSVPINIPGEIKLNHPWLITADFIPMGKTAITEALTNKNPYQAWINPRKLVNGLQIRQRRPGDRIQPLGLNGHSAKVSDLMINLKIPALARAAWPVVVCGETVVWVPGVRFGEQFRLLPDCADAIALKLIRMK